MENEHCVVLVTAPDESVAKAVADAALNGRLAACVSIMPGLRSIYRWKGEIHDEGELLLIMKTRADKFDALAEAVRAAHSYEVPEIIATPITNGNPAYLEWINENVR